MPSNIRPTSRRPKKQSRAQRPDIPPHPLVDPGNPPHSPTSRAKTNSTCRHHRMVALAAGSSSRSTEISYQTKITAVMLGLLLHAVVHPANVQDRDGAILVMATLFGMFPFLQKLFADGGYQGPEFSTALAKVRPHLNVEIVKRSDRAKGFVVLSKRWIVERTLAWLNRCRRLAKDWESRNRKALAFLHLASIRLMLRKLCNPA